MGRGFFLSTMGKSGGDNESKFEASRKADERHVAARRMLGKQCMEAPLALAVGFDIYMRGDGRRELSNLKGTA